MKVAVIGPVPPFRGGIAHSNTILCENLAKNHEVRAYSFSRLYPKFLYRGKFQKEDGKRPPKGMNVDFCIDSINPLNWQAVAEKINCFGPEVVIFQWWTTFHAFCYSAIAKNLKGKARISVVSQCALPHEGGGIHTWLAKKFYSKADSIVTLSSSDTADIRKLLPGAKVKFIIEPTYEGQIKKAKIPKAGARKKL
ncbi:MAG: hypothetical protein V1493_06810, partial [Candidatus Diapherotrites archaeon]